MKVIIELKNSLLMYPSIFENKWSVYHHWFIVNGNGYKWLNGELVYMGMNGENREYTVYDGVINSINSRFKNKFTPPLSPSFSKDRLIEDINRIFDINNRMKDFTPTGDLYPLCEYSKILNIPPNIKMDWYSAVKEFYHYLIDNYDDFNSDDQEYIDKIKI